MIESVLDRHFRAPPTAVENGLLGACYGRGGREGSPVISLLNLATSQLCPRTAVPGDSSQRRTVASRPMWHHAEVRRARNWLSTLFQPSGLAPNGACPVCSAPVVLFPTTYTSQYSGPMSVNRTEEEQVAACPVHGRSPFNNPSVKAARSQEARTSPPPDR